MKRCLKPLAILASLAVTFVVGTAWSDDDDPQDAGAAATAAAAASAEEAMARWMAASTPGENHEYLARQVGKWNTRMKVWMEGPQSEPSESTGTAVRRLILGGRFLVDENDGEIAGMPHQGFGLTGYDNFKQRFVSNWVDNMTTGILAMSGTLDAEGKVLTYYGQMDEPMTGEHDKWVKYVHREVSEDEQVFEIYDLSQGDGVKTLEITYTRAKE